MFLLSQRIEGQLGVNNFGSDAVRSAEPFGVPRRTYRRADVLLVGTAPVLLCGCVSVRPRTALWANPHPSKSHKLTLLSAIVRQIVASRWRGSLQAGWGGQNTRSIRRRVSPTVADLVCVNGL